jgi:hypothetical protein
MKKLFSLLVVIILFSACAPSPEQIQKAMTQTQAAIPTPTPAPTPTSIPLSKINLDNELLVEGDLPEGFVAGPIGRYTNNPNLESITGQEQMIIQEFSKTNGGIGLVSVFLFEETEKRNQAYDIAKSKLDEPSSISTITKSDINDIGAEGILYFDPVMGNITISTIIFVRCHAFAYLGRSMDDENSSVLRAYAKKLDERLTQIICQ